MSVVGFDPGALIREGETEQLVEATIRRLDNGNYEIAWHDDDGEEAGAITVRASSIESAAAHGRRAAAA